jgi:hypothetical protein
MANLFLNLFNRSKTSNRPKIFAIVLCAAMMQAFSVPAFAAIEQSSFRFIGNLDNTDPRFITSNHSSGNDRLSESAIDTVNGFVYTAGHSTTWIVEKRRLSDGALDTSFGASGILTVSISGSTSAEVGGIAIDLKDGVIYVAGKDNSPGATDFQWRIEKRNMSDGSLVTGFGTNGVVTSNPTTGDDMINEIIIDNITGYVIAGGYESTNGNGWRMEKRSTTNGALDTGFGTSGVILYNPSGRPEMVSAMAIDEGGGYFYVTGVDDGNGNTRWRVEKRKISNGALCSAAECGTNFQYGTGGGSGSGIYIQNPTNGADQPLTIQVDIAGNAVYFGGYDNGNGRQWRIVKVDASTAQPITAFGGNSEGAVNSDPSAFGEAEAYQLDLDGKGGFLYVIGKADMATTNGAAGTDLAWRIEKRQRSDGSLISTWGSSGSITINPSANIDLPAEVMIDVDRGILYAVGEDRVLGTTNSQWRYELFQLETGDRWYAAQDVLAIASTKVTFRLRLTLHISGSDLLVSDARNFKLQYAFKVGTCDTSFVGEIWSDIGTSGEIQYHDNPSVANTTAMLAVTGDPVHSGHTNVLQTIKESNPFTNSSNVPVGQDGLWDFVIKDDSAFGAYCFRAVNNNDTLLDSYSAIPEISFCRDDPRAENVMRHGTYFCEGTKRSFFWAR